MSDSEHVRFLRSMPSTYSFPSAIKDSLLEAADRIEELEGQVKLMNRLGNIDIPDSKIDERIKSLEERLRQAVTHMDLESLHLQIRQEVNHLLRK